MREPIRAEAAGALRILHLEGQVTVASARRLLEVARRLGKDGREVSVRCEHLTHIDCAGVQVLLALHETLRGQGARLRLQNLPESVQQTLRVAGLADAW
ncbi:MAG: STAS domain-containing protein [Candidatus Eisenbacteria bacterium]|uniref:STAS domain-containing protein n=1 Tax=Eiseniibacteriota bacterium TaxID=2212470 RepID=A0A933W9Q2_UNCEI|nr:STAS domain-containing protein [Candidatus Eisenbacteria bacterium]